MVDWLRLSDAESLNDTIWQRNVSETRLDSKLQVTVITYGILFPIGLLGNLRVICLLLSAICCGPHNGHFHIKLYILALSIVDLIFLLGLPVIIADILNQWTFGWIFCKIYWSFDCLNKLLSSFILVALSCNCYFAVCQVKLYPRLSTVRATLVVISVCVCVSVVLMTPLYIYADLFVLGWWTEEGFQVDKLKCIFYPPPEVYMTFVCYVVLMGFGLCSLTQLFFYASVLRMICRRGRQAISRIRIWNVLTSVLLLVSFYVACWTPYWSLQLYLQVLQKSDHTQGSVGAFPLLAAYLIHILPYFHAAFNPTLYLYLNKHIRQSVKSAQQSIRSYVSQKAESSRRRMTRSRSCPVRDSPALTTVRRGLRMTVVNANERESVGSNQLAVDNLTINTHCLSPSFTPTPTSLKRRLHFSFSDIHRNSVQL